MAIAIILAAEYDRRANNETDTTDTAAAAVTYHIAFAKNVCSLGRVIELNTAELLNEGSRGRLNPVADRYNICAKGAIY
jgi:hypothetical protein